MGLGDRGTFSKDLRVRDSPPPSHNARRARQTLNLAATVLGYRSQHTIWDREIDETREGLSAGFAYCKTYELIKYKEGVKT